MILGECPKCDHSWLWGWDEETYGFYAFKCEGCEAVFWIELARMGTTYSHEAFLRDIAIPDGRQEWAQQAYETRKALPAGDEYA